MPTIFDVTATDAIAFTVRVFFIGIAIGAALVWLGVRIGRPKASATVVPMVAANKGRVGMWRVK